MYTPHLPPLSRVQAVCLSPTFDLALQTGKVLEQMGKFLPNIKFTYAVKGHRREQKSRLIKLPRSVSLPLPLPLCSRARPEGHRAGGGGHAGHSAGLDPEEEGDGSQQDSPLCSGRG